MAVFTNQQALEEKEPVAGFKARFLHTDNLTLAYWDIRAGAELPAHSHIHEQVVNILAGSFRLTVDGDTRRLEPGAIVVIPSNVSHSGQALTDCRIMDIFYPVRRDYQ